MSLRLNLGAGGQRAPGWTSVDRAGDVDLILDIVNDPWPWEPGSVEGIVLHHVLDLLDNHEMVMVLGKCFAALEPGGTLRMSGASLTDGMEAALRSDFAWFAEKRYTLEETVGWFITQGGARKQYLHRQNLTVAVKQGGFGILFDSGFKETIGPDWITLLDSRENESWFAEAVR